VPDAGLVLLTGAPGVGKTTALRRAAARLAERGLRLSGFYTDEVRVGGERRGFRVVALDGRESVLADVSVQGPQRVGRYGVDVASFEGLALDVLRPDPAVDIYVVDEIGRMECLSPRFVATVRALLDSGCRVLATIALRGGGLIAETKARTGATLLEVTRANRDAIPEQVLKRFALG
jgi:nucleoside-triphosphatase